MRYLVMLVTAVRRRVRAWRLGWGAGPCPVCGRWFSCEELRGGWTACLQYEPHAGKLVCPRAECQDEARRRNVATYGHEAML